MLRRLRRYWVWGLPAALLLGVTPACTDASAPFTASDQFVDQVNQALASLCECADEVDAIELEQCLDTFYLVPDAGCLDLVESVTVACGVAAAENFAECSANAECVPDFVNHEACFSAFLEALDDCPDPDAIEACADPGDTGDTGDTGT